MVGCDAWLECTLTAAWCVRVRVRVRLSPVCPWRRRLLTARRTSAATSWRACSARRSWATSCSCTSCPGERAGRGGREAGSGEDRVLSCDRASGTATRLRAYSTPAGAATASLRALRPNGLCTGASTARGCTTCARTMPSAATCCSAGPSPSRPTPTCWASAAAPHGGRPATGASRPPGTLPPRSRAGASVPKGLSTLGRVAAWLPVRLHRAAGLMVVWPGAKAGGLCQRDAPSSYPPCGERLAAPSQLNASALRRRPAASTAGSATWRPTSRWRAAPSRARTWLSGRAAP